FEKQMRRKVHYVIKPEYLWGNIVHLAKSQNDKLLDTLYKAFKYIEEQSFSTAFTGLFSEINLCSEKLGKKQTDKNAKLCSIISEIARNDFNLNSSRYVSTAEPEEEIDLAATHARLVEIERTIRQATREHNRFLRELGLPDLP